jgi:hypothetical protein
MYSMPLRQTGPIEGTNSLSPLHIYYNNGDVVLISRVVSSGNVPIFQIVVEADACHVRVRGSFSEGFAPGSVIFYYYHIHGSIDSNHSNALHNVRSFPTLWKRYIYTKYKPS